MAYTYERSSWDLKSTFNSYEDFSNNEMDKHRISKMGVFYFCFGVDMMHLFYFKQGPAISYVIMISCKQILWRHSLWTTTDPHFTRVNI